MAVRFPFQKLCRAGRPGAPSLVFAACGPAIYSLLLGVGEATYRWSAAGSSANLEAGVHPNKRIKLDHEPNGNISREESEESIEIKVERRKGERRQPKVEQSKPANVSHILATYNGDALVAVTADDKAIHVFDIKDRGELAQRSCRYMPKRICALVLDPSENAIIVGDKFGDVYSLPLHPSNDFVRPKKVAEAHEPSATELTVHTKGNLEALQQQRKQKKINERKEGPDFEHKLLLGHVSLLTDVVLAQAEDGGKTRNFVLTADRDEHIRVSRYPQAHVIESYCFGHREFVSQLCIPDGVPELLISGRGEPSLQVFDWRRGVRKSQVLFEDFEKEIKVASKPGKEDQHRKKYAISGIWSMKPRDNQVSNLVLVALEGLPILSSFLLTPDGRLAKHQTLRLDRNILDVCRVVGSDTIIVSLDFAHNGGSVKDLDTSPEDEQLLLVAFDLVEQEGHSSWSKHEEFTYTLSSMITRAENLENRPEVTQHDASQQQRSKGAYSPLGEFLYGLENLRKRRGTAADDAEGEADEGEVAEIAA